MFYMYIIPFTRAFIYSIKGYKKSCILILLEQSDTLYVFVRNILFESHSVALENNLCKRQDILANKKVFDTRI